MTAESPRAAQRFGRNCLAKMNESPIAGNTPQVE